MFKRRKPEEQVLPPSSVAPRPLREEALRGAEEFQPAPPAAPPADGPLGVPPLRAGAIKETAMSRSPLPPSPSAPPAGPLAPQPGRPPRTWREEQGGERRTLVVGRGISLQGTVQDAERLVVEGTVEASMVHATELAIAPGGMFKGEIEVEDAEIAGTIDGTLTVRGSLVVRSTGRVLGTARCRRLQVEEGGQISGRIEMISEPAASEAPRPAFAPGSSSPA